MRIILLIVLFVSTIFAGDTIDCSNAKIKASLKISSPYETIGSRSKVSIMRGVMQNLAELRSIYQEMIKTGKRFEGKVVVKIAIDSRGHVLSSTLDSTDIPDTTFPRKVSEAILDWKFESLSTIHDTCVVKYPFIFELPWQCREADSVRTADQAIKIAVEAWIPIYGKKQIDNEKPYVAEARDSVWYVSGSLPEGWVGGTAVAEILRKNGKVINIYHEK